MLLCCLLWIIVFNSFIPLYCCVGRVTADAARSGDRILSATSFLHHFEVTRLRPGEDLKGALMHFARAKDIGAASVVSGIGSLRSINLRLAGALPPLTAGSSNELLTDLGHYEIISLSGTISKERVHIHISVSNETGAVLGGHLMEQCIIDTTAEVTLLVFEDLNFRGSHDSETGFKELSMSSKSSGAATLPYKNAISALHKLAIKARASKGDETKKKKEEKLENA